MSRVEFHPDADAEHLAAAMYYEKQAAKLGHEFISAVEQAAQLILKYPESGQPMSHRLRRVLVSGFPYGLVYRVEPGRIFIIAVMHLHRRPGYWISRS